MCTSSDFDKSTVKCKVCSGYILVGRLKYAQDKETCTKCANVERIACVPVITGKTGNTIQLTDQKTSARIYKAMARTGQSPGKGMKGQAKVC